MGGKTSKGDDWDLGEGKGDGEQGTDDDLPSLPYLKHRDLMTKLEAELKQSIWLANFKRAFRGYLRNAPERSQDQVFQRIFQNSKGDADGLGLPKDSFSELLNKLVHDLGPIFEDETIVWLEEKGKLTAGGESDQASKRHLIAQYQKMVICQVAQQEAIKVARDLYKKYSRGADADVSDVEVDPEEMAKMQGVKEARLHAAAEERRRQAEAWQKEAQQENTAQEQREQIIKEREQAHQAIEELSTTSAAGGEGSGGGGQQAAPVEPFTLEDSDEEEIDEDMI